MNQIEYFILPRRYKRTWALPRFCLLIAPWKRSHLTGMGMEVICTVQNGVCFEIRKKVEEEVFVHVSRRLLLSPVLRSDRHGDSVPDGRTRQDRLPPTSFSIFPCPLEISRSKRSFVLVAGVPPLCPAFPRFAPLVLAGAAAPPARPLPPPILSVGLLALGRQCQAGQVHGERPPIVGATPPGNSPSGCCIRLLVD
jgi:hypothetical protein